MANNKELKFRRLLRRLLRAAIKRNCGPIIKAAEPIIINKKLLKASHNDKKALKKLLKEELKKLLNR